MREVSTYCCVLDPEQLMTKDGHCLSFGCHIADSDVAPGLHVNRRKEGGGCTDSPDVDHNDVVCHHH